MEHCEPTNTPESTPTTSDSEDSPCSETESVIPSVHEPDVSLDEMLSLACRQGKLDIVQLLLQSGAHVNHRNKAGNTPLLEACSQGHVSVANYLLENGSKIDAPTETTLDSALTWACTLGNTNIVDALLHKKADVEHRTKDGCTALMFACLAGHKEVAEKLLDANSEINVESDSNKDSPLTFACWKGHFNVVVLLLERSANLEHRTKEGFSPLMFAALGGHTKVARKLLECDAQVNVPSGSNNDIPLTSACWKGHHNVVNLLLEFNSSIEHRTKDGCTPLMLAAREGHINVAELLLKRNAQVNVPSGSENNIPLTLACWKGHWEVVQILLDYGSDIEHRNKAGCSPLMLAAREGHYETTSLLLERNAQVNVPSGSNDDTPLTLACWKGHKEVVMLLLESKSNIDHQTKTGCTPLMEATREGHRDVAEILLEHNADVELPDNYGQSPLFMACWKGHHAVAELLLQKGAYRDCRTKTGITPLFQACRENHVSIVGILLQHGAGVNNPFPNSRENPLTLCAEKGHRELVELLLLKGASNDCRTKKGCTPEFLACKEGHMDIAQMLAEHGANLETPDCRGNTPIMAAYKNGHVTIVEWLIKYVHHLPSDELCHKILMSSVDEKDKELIVQRRSKCLATIQEMKKTREQLALRNAQNLVQELDDERNREEKKKKKKAAKRRDKQIKRKKNKESEKVEMVPKINGIIHDQDDDDDENDEEENKDHILPTENREKTIEDKLSAEMDVLQISHRSCVPIVKTNIDMTSTTNSSRRKSRKKSDRNKSGNTTDICSSQQQHRVKKKRKNSLTKADLNVVPISKPTQTYAETTAITATLTTSTSERDSTHCHALPYDSHKRSNPASELSNHVSQIDLSSTCRPTPKETPSFLSTVALNATSNTSVTQTDPRIDLKNATPTEYIDDWDDESNDNDFDKVVYSKCDLTPSTSTISRNNSFDEFKEGDWKELTRTAKLTVFELVVPNGFCGRVIGKGGKKINWITEESGGQITIDKPSSNIIPTERVITIKGTHLCAEKARYLVTIALNTSSLNNLSVEIPYKSAPATAEASQEQTNPTDTVDIKPIVKPVATTGKTLPPADVMPLLSYSKVATGTVSLEDVQKELLKKRLSNQSLHGTTFNEAVQSTPSTRKISDNTVVGVTLKSKESSPTSQAVSIKSEGFDSKEFSYFTQGNRRNSSSRSNQTGPLQSISTFVDPSQSLSKETLPWKVSDNPNVVDRSRSISWTGRPKFENLPSTENPSNRSLSTEAINDRQDTLVSPWPLLQRHVASAEELSDEQVFDDSSWPFKSKADNNIVAPGETWELSSSPTSSVSSSKVELTTILDNDSGMSGSNAQGPTPSSVHSDSRISFQDLPYLETAMDNNTWLQSRGAYSAPSSPALQRSADNSSRIISPKSKVIRSVPSMDELNNRPWKNLQLRKPDETKQPASPTRQKTIDKTDTSKSNRDSGVSSPPQMIIEKRQQRSETEQIHPTTSSAPWSAERFQDVHNMVDLLRHLSLDKYTAKLEEHDISLESLITLNERELQLFGIPKGPRLKIMKACEVIKSQKQNMVTHLPPNNDVSSSQTFISAMQQHPPLPPQQQHHLHQPHFDAFNKHQQAPFSSSYGFQDYLSYTVQPPYNVIIPNTQAFVHPPLQQSHQVCEDFSMTHPPVELHHNQTLIPHSYVYPDNQAYYFYTPPQT